MNRWHIAKYSLGLRELYDNIKDRIPGRLKGPLPQNRKTILVYVLPLVRKAFREGIDFARADVRSRFHWNIKASYQINQKMKEALFKEFIQLIKNAETIYKLKMEQREKLLKIEKRKDPKKGSDLDRIQKEYENGVKRAVNNLILNTGEMGQWVVFEKVKE